MLADAAPDANYLLQFAIVSNMLITIAVGWKTLFGRSKAEVEMKERFVERDAYRNDSHLNRGAHAAIENKFKEAMEEVRRRVDRLEDRLLRAENAAASLQGEVKHIHHPINPPRVIAIEAEASSRLS
jgi:Mg2+ and Co2+ transporter CorA